MSTHTPTPWKTEYENEYGPEYELLGPDGILVLQYEWNSDRQAEVEANASFVVRAVNCHDDLVAALKASRQWVEANTAQVRGLSAQAAAPGEAMLAQIDSAIAKATP